MSSPAAKNIQADISTLCSKLLSQLFTTYHERGRAITPITEIRIAKIASKATKIREILTPLFDIG